MSIKHSMSLVLRHGVSFKGRASRSEFWCGYLVFLAALVLISVLVVGMSLILTENIAAIRQLAPVVFPFIGVLFIVFLNACYITLYLFVMMAGLMCRRFQDCSCPAYLVLLALIFLPVVGFFLCLLPACCMSSTKGPNAYGEEPNSVSDDLDNLSQPDSSYKDSVPSYKEELSSNAAQKVKQRPEAVLSSHAMSFEELRDTFAKRRKQR